MRASARLPRSSCLHFFGTHAAPCSVCMICAWRVGRRHGRQNRGGCLLLEAAVKFCPVAQDAGLLCQNTSDPAGCHRRRQGGIFYGQIKQLQCGAAAAIGRARSVRPLRVASHMAWRLHSPLFFYHGMLLLVICVLILHTACQKVAPRVEEH